jgi:uncharacterized membrane protein required for colicin V production
LSWIDVAILATMLWFTYAAFHAGMIREVITIVGAIRSRWLAFHMSWLRTYTAVDNQETARLIASR